MNAIAEYLNRLKKSLYSLFLRKFHCFTVWNPALSFSICKFKYFLWFLFYFSTLWISPFNDLEWANICEIDFLWDLSLIRLWRRSNKFETITKLGKIWAKHILVIDYIPVYTVVRTAVGQHIPKLRGIRFRSLFYPDPH